MALCVFDFAAPIGIKLVSSCKETNAMIILVGDEADEAELLAAAIQEDSDLDDEDNSVTAI